MKKLLLLLLAAGSLASCKKTFQYSPNEVRLDENDKDLNARNIRKIAELPRKDTFRFIVMGDSQRHYEDTEDFVHAANGLNDIAFVVLAGDISDFGLNREFQWIARSLKGLKMPFIGVIGNHDMLANGRLIYSQMFGPENFIFEYSGNQFICLNTNSYEVGHDGSLPDLPWLERQLSNHDLYKNAFVISHVPPFDREFDQTKTAEYSRIVSATGKVRVSIHGHQHRYSVSRPYPNGPEYLVVGSMARRSFGLVTVTGTGYRIEEKTF
ncbi:MAG: hypothetical protein JWP69_1476 [Flaviaesturariibacter sp.]|nr:hypothetical protein [Flaviaesturariibacter sp.]